MGCVRWEPSDNSLVSGTDEIVTLKPDDSNCYSVCVIGRKSAGAEGSSLESIPPEYSVVW